MRTFGVPFTVHRQFGQRPAQHNSPRGRWYLKLRERTCSPAACSAPPIVCPGFARIVLPSNSNSQPCWRSGAGVSATRRLLRHEGPGFEHLIRSGVAAHEKPQLAGRTVIPPLGLFAACVGPVVEVFGPLPVAYVPFRSLARRPSVMIFPDRPNAAVG